MQIVGIRLEQSQESRKGGSKPFSCNHRAPDLHTRTVCGLQQAAVLTGGTCDDDLRYDGYILPTNVSWHTNLIHKSSPESSECCSILQSVVPYFSFFGESSMKSGKIQRIKFIKIIRLC